jgi:hypothetical protein
VRKSHPLICLVEGCAWRWIDWRMAAGDGSIRRPGNAGIANLNFS